MTNEFALIPVGSAGRQASLSSAYTIVTTGATIVHFQPLNQDVWLTTDGSTPTATNGFRIYKDALSEWDVSGGIVLKVLEVTTSAELRYQLYNKVCNVKSRGL